MWISKDGKLIHTTDERRQEIKIRISSKVLEELRKLAVEYDTFPNYLIESGITQMSRAKHIFFDKTNRPKDRKVYGTSFDKDTIFIIKELANKNNLFIADIVESSVHYIDLNNLKDKTYRYRIVKKD